MVIYLFMFIFFGRESPVQGCRSREKYLENEIFSQVREKSGNFVDGQGNLERTWKVREFENKWLWQAVFTKFIYSVQVGKGCTFS